MRDALGIFDTQAISVADLLWLIYIFVYNLCTCVRLSDPPREVFGVLRKRSHFVSDLQNWDISNTLLGQVEPHQPMPLSKISRH